MEKCRKYLSRFGIRNNFSFIRSILPVFSLEAVYCSKNIYDIEYEWQWLKNKIGQGAEGKSFFQIF